MLSNVQLMHPTLVLLVLCQRQYHSGDHHITSKIRDLIKTSRFEGLPMIPQRMRCVPNSTLAIANVDKHANSSINALSVEAQAMDRMHVPHPGPLRDVLTRSFPLPNLPRTPINIVLFKKLCEYHCLNTAKFLVEGLTYGFRLGFTGPITPGRKKPLLSSTTCAKGISKSILKELVVCQNQMVPFALYLT